MRTLLQIILLLLSATALAQDNVIPFQGQLADQSGQPLTPASPVTIVFRLYQVPIGGAAIWEEPQPNISVNAGRFSVLLGSRNALPAYTNFNATLYLGLTVDDGDPQTTDVEMRPRQALVPVISASYAKNADKLNGFDWSALFGVNNPQGNIPGSRIAPGTVTASQIAAQTITASQIASAAITDIQLAPGSVGSVQIENSAVVAEKIDAAAITPDKLSTAAMNLLSPPGSIIAFGGANEPDGWILCDGRPVSRTVYSNLFNVIKTAWGSGDEDSTFNVPDLRGVFLRGVNGSRNDQFADPGDGRTKGGGVGSFQADLFKLHNHNMIGGFSGAPLSGYSSTWPIAGTYGSDNHHWESGGSETRPKNAYVNYIIRY